MPYSKKQLQQKSEQIYEEMLVIKNKPIQLFNYGKMQRDFTYVDDIVRGIVAAIDDPHKCEIFNLGNNKSVELIDFVSHIENRLGKKAIRELLPMQPGDVPQTCADIEHIRSTITDLQWEAFTQQVVGQRIRFAGNVIEVYDDGRVNIDDCKGFLNVCMLYEIPRDIALTINNDQFIQGEGTVREVSVFIGLNVWINVESFK